MQPPSAWGRGRWSGSWQLPHPGEAYASRTLPGLRSAGYRFQVEGSCAFVLAPDERPPVEHPSAQPPGYPLGPTGPCALPSAAAGGSANP